jgi:beta-glucosidase/6-phospho-beta-glucosidase/beta-galactosidase/ABC-type amino acid transport substrate-binding protein
MNWRNKFTRMFRKHSQPLLPESFLFGVATADHQCEAYRAECEDIRDVWERERLLVVRGLATDFERRFQEDIELARKMGCKAFRFSISWSRIEPTPGRFDEEVFDYYRKLIETIRLAEMEPILTLHHFTWPIHVEERGGMIDDDFPKIYARYVAEVARRLGQEVRYWITFNEPNQLIFGYIKPWWLKDYVFPPGLPGHAGYDIQIESVGKLICNLFIAHTGAYKIIKSVSPDAKIGANPLLLGLPIWLQRLINQNAERTTPSDLKKQGQRLAEHNPVDRGRVDAVIAALTHTPERERQVMFSEAYFIAGQQLSGKSTSTATGVEDLSGNVIAVVDGSTAEQSARVLLPQSKAVAAKDYSTALQQLDQGQADALLADNTIQRGLLVQHPGQYKLLGEPLTTGSEPYGIAVTQGNRELLKVIDQVILRFKMSGELKSSYIRYLDHPTSTMPASPVHALSFGKSELRATLERPDGALPLAHEGTGMRRIQDRGYLNVAVRSDLPGFGFIDPGTGELSGLEIDLAHAIAKRIFSDESMVRFHPVTTKERIPMLQSPLRYLDSISKTYSILSTILASNWWHLGMAGRLPEFLCPKECTHRQDYVGLDYYWGIRTLRLDRIQALMDAGLGHFDRAPVWPGALYDHLIYQSGLFPHLPLIIMENGSVDEADSIDRATYIRQHTEQVQRAVMDGLNVSGYVCWAITSNREWGLQFGRGNDFGLYHIELDTDPQLQRVQTLAAAEYQQIIASLGVR